MLAWMPKATRPSACARMSMCVGTTMQDRRPHGTWLLLLPLQGTTACRRVRLEDLAPVQRSLSGTANPDSPTSWVRFVVGLPTFQDACTSGPSLDGAFSSATAQHNTTFVGCSGAPLERLAGFRFASALAGTAQVMCLDGVRLVSNAGAAQGS